MSHSSEAYLKVFKPEDVENANRLKVVFALDPAVDLLDHPLEAACVKCHGQGVSAVNSLRGRGPGHHKQPGQASPTRSNSGDLGTCMH